MFKVISQNEYLKMQEKIKSLSSMNELLIDRLSNLDFKQIVIEPKANCSTGPWCHSCENGYFDVDQSGQRTTGV